MTQISILGKSLNPKFEPYLGLIICVIATLLFTLTPFWQFAFLSGFLGGIFAKKMKTGLLIGFLGVVIGWGLYTLFTILFAQTMATMLDQIGNLLIGVSGYGAFIAIVIILIGGLMGLLGGAIGGESRNLFDSRKLSKTAKENVVE